VIGREHCDGMTDCPADFHHNGCHAECSACGHYQAEHDKGIYHCGVDIVRFVGTKRCTCTFVRKSSGMSVQLSQMRGYLSENT